MYELQYKELLARIAEQKPRETRNGLTQAKFGTTLEINELAEGIFPILKGRRIFWKGVVGELATFLQGPVNLRSFVDNGCNFWKAWADEAGNLTVDYGNSWLNFNGVNQLENVVSSIKNDPMGRRHLITGWRPDRLDELSLPCCHYAYQWFVNDDMLEMIWIQRSVDAMIGLPSDVIVAALFNILMAQTVGLNPGKITFQMGDTHIYSKHLEAYDKYTEQAGQSNLSLLPTWVLDSNATIFNFTPECFSIIDYNYEPKINIKVLK